MNDHNEAHNSIVSTLASLTAFDDVEAVHLAEILSWLRSTTDIYRRAKPSTPNPHLAVYCVPVDLAERRLFLGYHLGAQRWLPPGGHVNIGELPRTTALRECEEELGVVLDLYREGPILASVETTVGMDIHTDITLWFAFDCAARTPLSLTEKEFGEPNWISFSDVQRLDTNPNLERFLTKLDRLQTQATLELGTTRSRTQ